MFGGHAYAGSPFGGEAVAPTAHEVPIISVEWSPITDALANPVWVAITEDVLSWDVTRGRRRELERFQPGRATIRLDNRDAAYDAENTAGPNFGNLRPMRRVRIRATFGETTYPVLDGFLDKIVLEYPGTGKNAVATMQVTDGFKILARTDLPDSVYQLETENNLPEIWLRLDEQRTDIDDDSLVAQNSGVNGVADNWEYTEAPRLGETGLIVHDPSTSIFVEGVDVSLQGLQVAHTVFDPFDQDPFMIELWALPMFASATFQYVWNYGPSTLSTFLSWQNNIFTISVENDAGTVFTASTAGLALGPRRYVAAIVDIGAPLAIYVSSAGSILKTTGDTPTGTFTGNQTSHIGTNNVDSVNNFHGFIDEVAFYQGANILSDAQINDRLSHGERPWKDDLSDVRIGRILDEALWPANLRVLDPGLNTFQSAQIANQTALEHIQKAADSEGMGKVFMARDGRIRFLNRANSLTPKGPFATFGDVTGDVRYRELVPDDGDEVIRNRATISRLGGIAQTRTDQASVNEFGRFQFTLEGLLSDSDAFSANYAQFIVDEYGDLRRRITQITLGPHEDGEEATLYPAILGRELGDSVTVRHTPPGGVQFSQQVIIEGIQMSGTPRVLTATWELSPTPTATFV